ncbi:MAG: hypothetical protein U5L72_03350 [Bacteroidales bacterium]|nr:hypothetical protein [Bacteroidales bacterium]
MKCLYTFYYICSLNAIGANILYRGSSNRAWYQREVFNTCQTSADGIINQVLPPLSGTRFYQNGFLAFFKNLGSRRLHFEYTVEIMCGIDVVPSKYQQISYVMRNFTEIRESDDLQAIFRPFHMKQMGSPDINAESVI